MKDTYKPFNLEAAKKGAKVMTRTGLSVRILCFDVKNTGYPLLGLISNKAGDENVKMWLEDGRAYHSLMETNHDLVMAPTKRYLNLYRHADGNTFYPGNKVYDSEIEAVEESKPSYACGGALKFFKTIEFES